MKTGSEGTELFMKLNCLETKKQHIFFHKKQYIFFAVSFCRQGLLETDSYRAYCKSLG